MGLFLGLLSMLWLSFRGSAAPVGAQMSDAFVESAGICTHLSYTDKPYYTQWPTVRQRLLDLGVRHIRDGEATADFVSKIKDLANNGVRTIWVLDPGAGITPTGEFWTPSGRTRQLLVPFVKNNGLTNALSAVEIMNEIDLFYNRSWITDYTQAGYFWKANNVDSTNHLVDVSTSPLWWGNYIVSMASNTWSVMKADPATARISLIGPSFGAWHDTPPTGTNSLRDFVDFGCFHPYPFGGNPYSVHDLYATVDWYIGHGQQPSCNIDEWPLAFNQYQGAFGNKPMAATETGWFTGTANEAVSEAAQAKYVPRLYLEYFRRGIARCCHYELLDEGTTPTDNEQCRGLLRNDLTLKPAYTALKNLLGLLADPGPAFSPGALDLAMTKVMPSGYNRTNYLRSILFQKRDQTFWLVLYHELASSSYYTAPPNPVAITGVARDIIHPDATVNLTFNTPIAQATIFQPNIAATAITNYTAPQTLSVAVNDTPVVIELTVARPLISCYLSPVDQQPRLHIEGQAGHSYYLEQSTNLQTWTTASTILLINSSIEYTPPALPLGFWRVRTQ